MEVEETKDTKGGAEVDKIIIIIIIIKVTKVGAGSKRPTDTTKITSLFIIKMAKVVQKLRLQETGTRIKQRTSKLVCKLM